MSAQLYGAVRTAIQAGWGWAVAHWGILALVPGDQAVDYIVTVVVIGGGTALLRWLETRNGRGFWPSLARGIAAVVMLGMGRKQPVYVSEPSATSTPERVTYASGATRQVLPE